MYNYLQLTVIFHVKQGKLELIHCFLIFKPDETLKRELKTDVNTNTYLLRY